MSELYESIQRDSDAAGEDNDCAVTAVTAITGIGYQAVRRRFAEKGRSDKRGVWDEIMIMVLNSYGLDVVKREFHNIKTMTSLEMFIPHGKFLVTLDGHVAAVIDGVIHDYTAQSRKHVKEIFQVVRRGALPTKPMEVLLSADGSEFHVSKCTRPNMFPERRQLQNGVWAIPTTALNVDTLERNGADFDQESQLIALGIMGEEATRTKVLERTALFKAGQEVDTSHVIVNDEKPLSPYQQVAAANSIDLDSYAYFMDQGTGKTAVAIADMCNLADRHDEPRPFLTCVVCPNNVRLNWEHEIHSFATCSVRTTVVRDGGMKRLQYVVDALKPGPQLSVMIIGYDTVRAIWDHLSMVPFDVAYWDESHWAKDPNTKRCKYMFKLRDIAKKQRVMTGTPIGNSHVDLFSQMELLGEGQSGFTNWKAFKNFYGVYDKNPGQDGVAKLAGVQNVPFMKKRLAMLSIQFMKEEVLPDMPEKMYSIREVEMTKSQREVYRKISTEIEAEINDKGDVLQVNNILVKMMRLAQVTSGHVNIPAVYSDDGELLEERRTVDLANPKMDALVEFVENELPAKSKMVIWSCFRYSIHEMMERFGTDKAVYYFGDTKQKDRVIAEDRFNNDPECRIIVANAACCGVGTNFLGYNYRDPEEDWLDTNADWMSYFDQDWSFLKRAQSEDRSHRRGTRVPLNILDWVIPGTVDEEIRSRVIDKKSNSLELRDVRDIMKRILLK